MEKSFWLKPKDKEKLLIALIKTLTGKAYIMLQGNLSDCDFSNIPGISFSKRAPFHSMEGLDEGKFVIIPLEPETIDHIFTQILPEEKFINQIEHIQIEENGKLEFMAGDNFHDECISVGPNISEHFLKDLVAKGILQRYMSEEEAKKKFNR